MTRTKTYQFAAETLYLLLAGIEQLSIFVILTYLRLPSINVIVS